MKVYIAPYKYQHSFKRMRNLWYKLKHGKKEWLVHDEELDKYDHAFERTLDFVMPVINKYYVFFPIKDRKIDVRIDDYDVWGMDETLSHIIVPMLELLKKNKHGTPIIHIADVPFVLTDIQESHGIGDDDTCVSEIGWDWIMDEMIWAMKQLQHPDEGMSNYYDSYAEGEELETITIGGTRFLTDEEERKIGRFNTEKCRAYNDRIKNGTSLFGKYYNNLWD